MIGEHDVLLIHRDIGVIFIEVKNLTGKQKGKNLKDAVKRNVKTATNQVEKYVCSLDATMSECGLEKAIVSLSIIALPNVKRDVVEGISSSKRTIFLCEEDCQSTDAMEQWWMEHIPQSHKQETTIDCKTYLQLLAM